MDVCECGDALGGSHARVIAARMNKTTHSGAFAIYKIEKSLYDSTFARRNKAWGRPNSREDVRHAIGDPAIEMSRIVAWCVCAFAWKARRTFQRHSSTFPH